MKRCNNCGWFNLDSAVCCEKCEEDSFELVESAEELHDTAVKVSGEPAVVSEPEVSEPVQKRMMATVAFGNHNPVSEPVSRKSLSATVMDASSIIAEETVSQCPKCNYPISGGVPYCPNCGATIKKSNASATTILKPVVDLAEHEEKRDGKINLAATVMLDEQVSEEPVVPAATVKESSLKATVLDIPDGMISDDEVFMLVPMDGADSPIELKLGKTVFVGGRKYIFQK